MTKTAGIKALVEEVLESGRRWSDDVIVEVFVSKERTSGWRGSLTARQGSSGLRE